ncbi:MAG: TIR domain-containing protein, partial [Verrucomicrobiota bacterium]
MATVSSPEFKYHAFVSHSSQDNEFVRKLGDDLERAGAKIFDDDRCIKPAANIVHSIEEALHESRKLILVMSKAWERSEWTAAEFFPDLLEDPMNVDRRIIPILLDEECEPPRQIRVLKHIDFTNQEDYSIRLRELIEALDLVAPAYEMSNTASAPPALLDTVPIPSLSEISFGFASEVATLYKLLGFTVSSHLGNLRVHQNLGFRSEIEVLCEEGVVSEDRAGQILEEIQAGGNGKFGVVASRGFTQKAWQSLSGAGVECLTYSELLDQLLPLEGYIRSHIVDQWEGRVNDPDRGWGGRDLFIRPRVRDDFTNEESKALDRFSNWLGNDRDNFLIILGDLGTGKSTLCEFLAYQLAQAFLEDPSRHPAPVLIPLREARRAAFSLETIVATHFAVHGMPDARFANFFHLVRRRRIVLFFDAFDEMADRIRWNETRANFAELKRSVQPGTKVVMTCRTHYFKSREEQLETLNGGGLTFSDTATELYRAIHGDSGLSVLNQCEFNASEIETYMRKARPERWEKDIAKMEEIHNLSGLAHRPLLLDMIVKSLPRLDHNQEVTAADLYATYTSFWIQREEKKHPTLRPEHKLHLMMELAWHLWKEHRNEVQEDQLIAFVEKLDRVRIHEEEPRDIVREMHTATFLQRGSDGRSFRFVHRSFMEYFIARRLCDDCGLLHGSAPVVEINPAVFDLPRLDQKIVFFLAGLDKEDQLRSPLAAVLSAGYWERVSENALQILYWSCRIRLGMEKEISDIELLRGELLNRIPAHAQLDESKLDQMVLEGAVLRGANLRGANLTDTNLNRADLTGAKSMGAKRDGLLIDEAIGIEPGDAGFEGGAVPVCQLGHSTKVRAIAYDPEGKWMACGADDGSVAIREPDTGRIVWLFTHHHAPVRAVTFSPDGKYLASCGDDRSIKIQKMATGEMVHDIHGHAFSVLSIAFSPDGSLLVSGSGDRSIFLWDVRSGFQLLEFQGHTGAVNSVAFSSDGFFFASGSDDGSVRLWEVDTGKQRMQLEAHSAPVRSVAICPRNLLLATSSEDQGVKLWAIESGVELRKLNGHGNAVNSVAFSPSGDYLASASTDHDITLWEVE